MPVSAAEILDQLGAWRLMPTCEAASWGRRIRRDPRLGSGDRLAKQLIRSGKLTRFQFARIQRGEQDSLVVGDYVLVDRLGAGAMGRVYKAWDRSRRRWAAVKVLRTRWVDSPRHLVRFHRELRAARRLRHPHIVRALGAGRQGERYYLAMEYVDGPNLEAYLHEHGSLPVAEAVKMARQAADALAYAHAKKIIHRDVKPSNLLVGPDGEIKILDMGIARVMSSDDPLDGRLTHSGQLLGTPHYMAPEQALDPRNAGPACDIYSLGCTLYRMLAGEMPYTGESDFDVLLAHLRAPVPSILGKRPDAPPELDAICRRMIAKNEEHRYGSMREVIRDLDRVPAGSSPASRTAPPPTLADASEGCETLTSVGPAPLASARRSRWRTEDDDATLAAAAAAVLPAPLALRLAPVWAPPAPTPPGLFAAASPPPSLPSLPQSHLDVARPPADPATRRSRRRRTLAPAWIACVTAAAALAAGMWFAGNLERGGSVSLEVYPREAWVEVFDERSSLELRRLAAGDVVFQAAPGRYRLRITKRGFAPYVRDFALESGGRTTLRAVLERE